MAAFCINTHSQEFKDAAKRLGVSQFELEQIAYKYGNQEGTFGQFPSDEYIKEQLDGVPNYNATEAQAELWKMRYSTPREFDTLEELNAAKKDALQYFGDESVHSFVNADGKYELRVAEQDNEYQRIKEQAIADGTFMKAPNGNQSNLNEQQWLQVRTKAFKDWFGDWEKAAKQRFGRWGAFNPNQIKSAERNIGAFSESDANIYRNEAGKLVPRKWVLSGYEEHKFNEYLKKSRGVYPKSFTTSWHGERVTLEKVYNNKNSRKYRLVGEDGRIIAESIPLYTEEEYKVIQEKAAENKKKLKPYNEGASIRFKTFLEVPSKGLFKYAAKTWLSESLEVGNLKVDYKDIDAFVDKFPDSFWENVVTYVLNPKYGNHSTVFGEMTTLSPWQRNWVFNPTIPKQGLIENLEKRFNVKIDGRELFGKTIDRNQKYGDLERMLIEYLDGRARFSEKEALEAYAKLEGVSVEEAEEFKKQKEVSAREDGDMVSSKTLEFISKAPIYLAIQESKIDYNKKFKEHLQSKGIRLTTGVANIIFNREIFSGDSTRINRLATIFHEPFHALEILAGNTEQMQNVYTALDNLLNTKYGQELSDSIADFNTAYSSSDIRSEILANMFSLLMMPERYRNEFVNQSEDNEILGAHIARKINELLSREPVKKFLEAKTVEEERIILDVVKEEEKEALPLLKRIWNSLIDFFKQYLHFVNDSLKFAEKTKYINKTVSRIDSTETTVFKEVEKVNEELIQFKDALDSLNSLLQEISGIEITEDTKLREQRSALSQYNTSVEPTLQTPISQAAASFTLHSGGAHGSDLFWDAAGKPYGLGEARHYYHGEKTPGGNIEISPQDYEEGRHKVAEAAAYNYGYPYKTMKDDRLIRNWAQVKYADAIFAVGTLVRPGERLFPNKANDTRVATHAAVTGGTGYAVGMAILAGKPVYVFDQVREKWFKYIDGKWSESEVPTLTPNFAGIGSRQLNDIGKRAIEAVYEKTFSQQQAPQQQSSINIWAGSNENADLSNMAQRPFTYNGRQYSSVEYAFQSAKLEYAAPLTQQPIDVQEAFNNPDLSSKEAKKFGNKIVGLDRARWDADKFGIMKELIKASFQQNPQALQRLLSTGDAVLTHNQESSIWKTEFPRILMEVRSELSAEQQVQQTQTQTAEQEPLLAPPSVEREFHTKEVDLVTKIDNLFSGDIDASEISAEANKAVDWISDQLTQYMEDHELVYKKFFEDNPSSPSKEEVMKKLDGISSRREMLETVGLDKMIEFYKEEVLSMTDENADIFDNMDDAELDKYDAIKDNIEGLIQLGYSRFLGREGFGFTISDVEGETFSVTEERSKEDQINPDDFNGQADIDGNEEVRNQQEHWQIENATRDIMDNASAKVKQAIADCYILEDNGKVDENSNKKYDIARDNLNRNERVVPIQAVRSIVKWTQGALTLSQMVAKLEARLGTDPWISQIVTRLKDTTGNEADFQSQFFNTFCKHFQPYSIVKRRADGTFYTMVVNAHPALNDALNALSIQYKTGAFPLVNEEGVVQMSNVETLAALRDTLQGQGNLSEENRADTVEIIGRILEAIGMPQPSDAINRILTNTLKDLVWANTKNIVEKLTAAAGEKGYNPFQYTGNKNGIRNYLSNILRPFTNQLEDTLVSSVFDSGKMYQSYITPSWTTKLFTKMHLPDREFKQFILNEFGKSEWFIDSDALTELATLDEQGKLNYLQDNPNVWRLPWIGELMRMSEADRQKAFNHKVQLNFNKQNYMRGMNDLEYVMSVFTEYFAESSDTEKGVLFGNYRFPMISNKPSNEFIRFIRHTGTDGRVEILDGLTKIFHQELSRIQTVEMRNLKEGDAGYIANFDANEGKGKGLQFNFLDYLNEYLNGSKKDTALGKLIDRKLHATEANQLTSDELTELDNLVQKEIKAHLDGLADRLISQYKQNGLFEALKNIEHIGKTDAAVEDAIREFAWNDNYAEANILEMLVTDKAFYKNEEDLQKRLAQVHSPGIRGNWEATDFEGNAVSDGKVRVLKLADYAGIISDTIDNVEAVFDKKIAENPNDREGWEALKESVLAAYRDINVVDGQAFVSPTAYRKKAFAFGEWTKDDEEVYHALLQGKANLAQIKRVFNPRKPFTYGKVNKSVSAGLGTPIKTLNYGVQYKNSEYLLIMADALLRGQETGRPNLLGALFDVMEESAKSNPTRGIDFVVFESGVKTGLTGAISINEFIDDPNGREKAFTKLWNSAFREDGSYNEDFIDVLDAEDYTTQQTVPEHFFLHGGLQWGSQIRAMATSDLETTFNGEPVLYEYVDPLTGKTIPMDAQTIRDEWERNTAAYIQKGIDELSEELGLNDNMSIADRNILISKLLQREILSNQRYGVDLLLACSVDENGNFRIPLGDPIQSKRVEQLLNSIVKNRINKQKVEGGNLVEVTNFGTSKKLEIRYKDKEGNLLTSKRDYLAQGHTEAEFKQYLKENQYGIAYHECYAPAWARDVFQKFADEKGSVDVEAIRMLSPDLLKMFGYRIPTEDKYSTAPYMIVGFLPQEAGDGFMQPWETTVIDGSDFDVDKKNLMRMVLDLKSRLMSKREFYESKGITEDTEETQKEYRKYRRQQASAEAILEKIGEGGKHTLSSEEEAQVSARVDAWYDERVAEAKEDREILDENALDHYNEAYEREVAPLEARYNELDAKEDLTSEEEKEMQSIDKKIDRIVSRLDRKLEGKKAENERRYNEKIAQLDKDKQLRLNAGRENFLKDKKIDIIRQILDEGIFRDSSTIPENQRAIFLAVKQAYLDSMFEVVRPKEGTKGYLNNKMFNMQWAIATHASTADKMLNPGNFDPQKRMGYMVAANRLGYAWSELEKMKTSAIKDLVFTSKNLMDFDVQTQFYKQNAVAGQILGIFAVAKSAHAMFEGRNYGILVDSPFSIDGMEFSGAMHYDVKYDRNGVTLVGKHLGSLVGASADAVKDPVLNFMNINKETINVLNTALRLGLDFDTASLLLSSKAVSDVLDIYRRKSLSEKTSFDKEVRKALRDLEKKDWIGKNSSLKNQDLTKKEMIWAITGKVREGNEEKAKQADQIVYKILNAVYQLSKLSQRAQPLTDLSRLNSVTSAPGPLHINTIASDRKIGPEISMDGIIKFKDNYKDIDGNTVEVGEFEGEGSYVLDVQVNRNNLDKMLLAGAIERFEDYDTVDREMVFNDIPSLRAFYRSYEIVKQLFKDLGFTTASDSFNNVLAAVPEDIEFSLYNKEKLLSSLADFFQSYILIQSGVVKSSWLKNYAQNFVKEYVKADYKSQERFRKNPLIQAIQPTLISKEGEPDRYALKIETTGMEQSEKDALSAGWIQLEKQDPELSHKLFVYNFFRGGIGFNPKTFMGLVPIQVKEKIQGYIEAYTNIPRVDGATVIDQWVRNNWMNNDLVTPVNLKLNPEADVVQIEKKYIYNTPSYIRTTVDGKNYLYRLTSIGDKSVLYKRIDPLGNNGEYLEMYETNATVSPFDNPQRGTLEIQESDHLEEKVDDPMTDQPTVEEQTRELVDFYQTAYDIESTQEREETSNDESFDKANKDLDITVNKDKFDEILEDFC